MSMEKPGERDSDLVFWTRWWLEQVPADEFLEIHGDEQLRAAQFASAWWGGDHFTPAASRYVPGRDEKHCFHIGQQDVLRHQYEVAGLRLTVLETAADILTRVEVDLGPPAGHAMAVQRIAATLFLGGNAPLHFFPWKARDESARFSTDPVGAMGMPPPNTIGGSIVEGRVYFVIDKSADPRRSAFGSPPTKDWLGGPLLAAWKARQPRP